MVDVLAVHPMLGRRDDSAGLHREAVVSDSAVEVVCGRSVHDGVVAALGGPGDGVAERRRYCARLAELGRLLLGETTDVGAELRVVALIEHPGIEGRLEVRAEQRAVGDSLVNLGQVGQ